jgi:hypothetical protein
MSCGIRTLYSKFQSQLPEEAARMNPTVEAERGFP